MNKIYKFVLACGVVAINLTSLTGCIEETTPTSYATTDQMAESSSATDALLSAMPASLSQVWRTSGADYSWGYGSLMKIRDVMTADEAIVEDDYDWYTQWEQNYYIGKGYLATQFVWNYYYKMVLTANNMVMGVNPEIATNSQLGYLGVGYAFRALFYLDMARMYEFLPNDIYPDGKNEEGNNVMNLTVPIVRNGMTEEEARVNPRATRDEMAAFIEEDLNNAETYIEYLTDTRDKTLPDLACIYGLKARLYMWIEDYPKAQEYARKAINESGVSPVTKEKALNTSTGFNTTEPWMWGASQTAESETVVSEILNWTSWMSNETQFGYASAGPFCMIGRSVYDRISDTDWRKLYWAAPEGSALADQVPFLNNDYKEMLPAYASVKFRPGNGDDELVSVGAATSYPVMRVEEMYLIEAEAAAHQNASQGQSLINSFMKTRDANYNTSLTGNALIEEIVFQKRVELWGEGQAFFDIKRLDYPVIRGYVGTNFATLTCFNTARRPAWMNFVIVETEENNNKAVAGFNNPDPSDKYTPWIANQ